MSSFAQRRLDNMHDLGSCLSGQQPAQHPAPLRQVAPLAARKRPFMLSCIRALEAPMRIWQQATLDPLRRFQQGLGPADARESLDPQIGKRSI